MGEFILILCSIWAALLLGYNLIEMLVDEAEDNSNPAHETKPTVDYHYEQGGWNW